MIAAVGTAAGIFLVDVEAEELLGDGTEVPATERPEVALPRVVAAARSGSTVVAVVERRPPLMLSNDGGATWREAGGGLPPGFAVAIAEEDPGPDALRRPQPALRLGQRRRLLAVAAVRAAGHRLDRLDRLKEALDLGDPHDVPALETARPPLRRSHGAG